MDDLRLITIWAPCRTRQCVIPLHSHNYYELVYYTYGSGITEIGSGAYPISSGHFALIPPHTKHDELHHADAEIICLGFHSPTQLPLLFREDTLRTVRGILTALLSEAKTQNYGYEEMILLKLRELLIYLFRTKHTAKATQNFEYIINYLRENFHEHIVLNDFARQLNISYDYFQHKFKALTGASPQQFLMEQRLLSAEKLLRTGDSNCTQIASLCGFCTSAQFSALFKKRYGQSPLQYRKQHL